MSIWPLYPKKFSSGARENLAVLLDLFARRVVGWATSDSNDSVLALESLGPAMRSRKPDAGLIHHTDRGGPYACADYRKALKNRGILRSMSRKGDCWDNAVAESFLATLRAEHVDHHRFLERSQARQSISEYIEGFYNVERSHWFLGYLNPVEFELRFLSCRSLA